MTSRRNWENGYRPCFPEIARLQSTPRAEDLRRRVRDAMSQPPVRWDCPARIDERHMTGPVAVRKARAIGLKLAHMPSDLWRGQLFAGSMTLEDPRVHAEWGFPDYTTEDERQSASRRGLSIHTVFGHIVPDYPRLLAKGLTGIRADAEAQRAGASDEQLAFLDSVVISVDAVMAYADRLAQQRLRDADESHEAIRASELRHLADTLRHCPRHSAQSFEQALQAVWLLHMIFHSTMNGNAMGRVDQYVWPYLKADLDAGVLTEEQAAELCACFCLKFNERAKTTDEQRPEERVAEDVDLAKRTRHWSTSSQVGSRRDGLDATNHWLQNIVIGGIRTDGSDGTNLLTHLLLEAYRRNEMTNPLMTLRVHDQSPDAILTHASEVLKDGGGMPAIFNDGALVPALERIGIPTPDARDYTNDGCWEVIIPGRTDFRFQRISVMLALEYALNRGRLRVDGAERGPDTGDPRAFGSWDDVWGAFLTQLDAMVERTIRHEVDTLDQRYTIAPVPLLSALIDGAVESRRDMTTGGAKFRTFGMLIEGAAHAIDSLTAIKTVVFADGQNRIAELCDALDADFEGHGDLRRDLLAAPKYGNDDEAADSVGRDMVEAFTSTVARHAEAHRDLLKFPCGVATFSWYIGIGEGLGTSADGRLAQQPLSSNFSPALGRDVDGIPSAILSYSKMHHCNLPAGAPLDLRVSRKLVEGDAGTQRMVALIRGLVDAGGSMMTLTVADVEELRAAQRDPDDYESLRVRMGGWCAYFTMLSHEQQDHHIRRQEGS